LKDGPVVFFLALSILATLKLGEKMTFKYLAVLVCSLFAILSLRFYIFYMITVAIVGAFVIGMRAVTATSFLRQFAVVIIVGLALTYLGVNRYASVQVESFANLQRIQRSRLDAATSAQSGFGQDVDVSSALCSISLASCFHTAKHHLARDGDLVDIISVTGTGIMVLNQVSTANDISYSDLYGDAYAVLLGVSRQCRNGLSPTCAVVGVLFHLRGGGFGADFREARGKKAPGVKTTGIATSTNQAPIPNAELEDENKTVRFVCVES
jgi:hypothetical protein